MQVAGRYGERRAAAVRISAAAVAVALVIAGPLVLISWRWAFIINLPVGIVLLVRGCYPRSPWCSRRGRPPSRTYEPAHR
jgi:MFS family permease